MFPVMVQIVSMKTKGEEMIPTSKILTKYLIENIIHTFFKLKNMYALSFKQS